MAYFTPVRGTRDEINQVAMVDGQFLYETDQGSGNRILADVADENGDLKRVQVGGERGEDNKLSSLKDVVTTSPALGDYLKYDGDKWINDATLNAKVANLSPTGKFDGNNVTYDGTKSIVEVINTKTTLPSGGNVGDALCKTIDGVAWQKVKIDVIDSLDSTSVTEPLSANQGRNLRVSLESISNEVIKKQNAPKEIGKVGQALCLDDSLQPIWKTISGGGGGGEGGAKDWSDLEGKPFNKIYSDDTLETITNPDFHIDKVTTTSGTIKTLMLNDALVYRPTDNDIIASNSTISYIPCSAVFAGNQVKKKISWSDLLKRIEGNMFELTNPQPNDLLIYSEGKWKNDNSLYNKLSGFDGVTIKKDANNNLYVNVDDSTIKITGTGSSKKLSIPIDNSTISIGSDGNMAVPIDNKTIKMNGTTHKLEVGTDGSTIIINSNDKMEVPIDDSTIKVNTSSKKLEVPIDNKSLKVNSSKKLAVNYDGRTIVTNESNQLCVPIDETSILFDGSGKMSVNYDNSTIVVNGSNKLGVNYDGTTLTNVGDKLRVNIDNSTLKTNTSGKLEVPAIKTIQNDITTMQTSISTLNSTITSLTSRITKLEALLGKKLVTAEMSSGTLNFTSFTL